MAIREIFLQVARSFFLKEDRLFCALGISLRAIEIQIFLLFASRDELHLVLIFFFAFWLIVIKDGLLDRELVGEVVAVVIHSVFASVLNVSSETL